MINHMRKELVSKCAEIENKRIKTEIGFEVMMIELERQKAYLEKLIFDIDEYHHKLVENVVEEEKEECCLDCVYFEKKDGSCYKNKIPKPSDHAVNLKTFKCDEFIILGINCY